MSKRRLFYIFSFVILGVLLVSAFWALRGTQQKYSEVSQASIIQREDQWIIQINILNKEGKVVNYTINWSTGGETYSEKVSIKDGRIFTYIHYVYPEMVEENEEVNLTIYKEGESIPFEQVTYYIRFDQE